MSNVLNDKVLTFLNRATKIHLGPLDYPSIRSYYASTFERAGFTFTTSILNAAVEATAGFPYLLQLIGYYLFEEAQANSIITQSTLERAIADARDDMKTNVFRPTLAALSAGDLEFLNALAIIADEHGVGSAGEVRKFLNRENGYVQVYRRRLIDAEVIDSPQPGKLEFIVPFLRDYLLSKQREETS